MSRRDVYRAMRNPITPKRIDQIDMIMDDSKWFLGHLTYGCPPPPARSK